MGRYVVLWSCFCGETSDPVYLPVPGDPLGTAESGSEAFCDDPDHVSGWNLSGMAGRKTLYGTAGNLCVPGRQRPLVFIYQIPEYLPDYWK